MGFVLCLPRARTADALATAAPLPPFLLDSQGVGLMRPGHALPEIYHARPFTVRLVMKYNELNDWYLYYQRHVQNGAVAVEFLRILDARGGAIEHLPMKVYIHSPAFKTARGIGVANSVADFLHAYPDAAICVKEALEQLPGFHFYLERTISELSIPGVPKSGELPWGKLIPLANSVTDFNTVKITLVESLNHDWPSVNDGMRANLAKFRVATNVDSGLLHLDGEYWGPVRPDSENLAIAGMHTVKIEAEDYVPWQQTISLAARRLTPIAAQLKRAGR
jgi:hypothetical protein